MKKLLFSVLISVMMVLSASVGFVNANSFKIASAETVGNLVALGDSITTGCRINGITDEDDEEYLDTAKDNTNLYVNKLATNINYSVSNYAVNGAEIDNLILEIAKTEVSNALTSANLIVITIGGNDIMSPMLDELNTSPISFGVSGDFSQATKDSISENTSNFQAKLPTLISNLKAKNSTAQIILQTVYNPAENLTGDLTIEVPIIGNYGIAYSDIYDAVNPYITALNTIIKNNASTSGYTVADVYTAFKDSDLTLTNLEGLDIHPNIAGHNVIYTTVNAVFVEPVVEPETQDVSLTIYTDGEESSVGGSITEANAGNKSIVTITVGTPKTIHFVAASGYEIEKVLVGSENKGVIESYEIDSTIPESISVYFVKKPVYQTVNYEIYTNKEKSPVGGNLLEATASDSEIDVIMGKSSTIHFTASEGYTLSSVEVDGSNLGQISSLDFNGRNFPTLIKINFLKNIEVTFTVGQNGQVTAESSVLTNATNGTSSSTKICLFGNNLKCVISPEYGYEISSVKVNGTKADATNNEVNLTNITETKTIVVEFNKIQKTEFIDSVNNITLNADTTVVPYGTALIVSQMAKNEEYNLIKNNINAYSKRMIVYSLHLQKDNVVVNPTGNVEISIQIPNGFNIGKTKLYHYSADNVATEISYKLEDGNIVFETNHFSNFVLIEIAKKDMSFLGWLIPLIVLGVVALAGLVTLIVFKIRKRQLNGAINK